MIRKGEKRKRRKREFETKREALEYECQKKFSSSRSMDMKLGEFMEVYFGNQMMSEITVAQTIQWQNEMQTKGFSESYLRMIQN